MTHIVIIEDELHLAQLERDYLKQAGYEVSMLHRGDEALAWLAEHRVDLIVLDLMLPGTDGLTICRSVRQHSQTPIIMTTAKVEEIDRLIGLELGADDYLCKPFSLRELVARVKTVLRRMNVIETPNHHRLFLLPDTLSACLNDDQIELTLVELNLLELLMAHPRRIFSRDQIIDRIYDDRRVVSDRTIDSHIKKLRKKLHELTSEHDFIQSVYGAGYRFEPL